MKCVQVADNLPIDILDKNELERFRKKAEEYGIVIEIGMKGIDPREIEKYIDITSALGSRLLRCVPGIHESDPVTIDDIAATLRDFLPVLKERDIVFGVENHDKFRAVEHEKLMQMISDDRIGIVLDTTNSLSIEEPIDEIIEHTAEYCVCLHMKDYQIQRFNDGMGLQITSSCLGTGRQNIPYIYEEICKRTERDFNIILESWMTPLGTLEESLAREDAWVRSGIKYMQGLTDL